ncbi:RIP metalloprotease RseP [Wolbachia endosymbiont of Pentidionis agamae]|uniref:RIP metalloprotease RseP n=1 Tax=Wolbachia endosymbiont of Pentidionis agamae TaxID=3110435 RepID=UPI002FD5B8BD
MLSFAGFFSFFLILSIIVFIHEYGHYIVAKFFKVKVESFSIGLGPEIFGLNDKSGTRWKLSLVPLGGYVKMLGDTNEASVSTAEKELTDEERLHAFCTKPLYQKSAIIFAGPFANILLAIVVLTVLFFNKGSNNIQPIVGNIVENSPAQEAGLLPGDSITYMNGHKIKHFDDIVRMVLLNPPEEKIEIQYQRNKEEYKADLKPRIIEGEDAFGNIIKKQSIGITSTNLVEFKSLSIFASINKAIEETYHMVYSTAISIYQLISGKRSVDEIGGPIKIAMYSGQSAKKGIFTTLYFLALISVNIGVINLLPIPILDGGHLFQYMIEGLFRRRVSIRYQKYAAAVGISILFSLMAIAVFNDVKYLFMS